VKVAVADGRVGLVLDGHLVDVEQASNGRVSANPVGIFENWDGLLALAGSSVDASAYPAVDEATLELPIPVPRQAFGIGVNYRDHATEAAMELPKFPMVFPKFSSCIVGPNETVGVTPGAIDWEAELVVVIGRDARDVSAKDAWSVIAGLAVGQDISDRTVQFEAGANPQFGLGKSAPGFGPIGPWLVSADEFVREPELDVHCEINGVLKQDSNTRYLIFNISTLVAYVSERVQLLAGDVIFTGTPAGVGWGRDPKEYIGPGDVITTTIEGIGTITTRLGKR
jgi:2,4-diketo-3-deoxy-L-fuconate hydrolase